MKVKVNWPKPDGRKVQLNLYILILWLLRSNLKLLMYKVSWVNQRIAVLSVKAAELDVEVTLDG